jgi:(p)ppGpp synthase/HD superfamily hydrolase
MISRALDFAARKHVHQRRKGELAEPYVNHVTDVARILAEVTDGSEVTLIIAGLLHDTIEDQKIPHAELTDLFGKAVADLVLEVTDDMTIPKPERKLLQVANAPTRSTHAKMLRIADKISNLNSILTSPPKHWDISRRLEYFEWAKQVVAGCSGINTKLDQLFDATYQKRHLVGV